MNTMPGTAPAARPMRVPLSSESCRSKRIWRTSSAANRDRSARPACIGGCCSPGHEFDRRLSPAGGTKPDDELAGSRGRVFGGVGLLDRVTETLATNANGPNPDLPFPNRDRPVWILEECPKPAVRLEGPRTYEDAALDDDGPYTGEAVIGARACTDAEDLALVDRRHKA